MNVPPPSSRYTGRLVSNHERSKAMPNSFSSSLSRHSRNGVTNSKWSGPTLMSIRLSPSFRWARTVVCRPRRLTMANASAVPRLG